MKRILVYGMSDNKGGTEAYIMNFFRKINRENVIFDFLVDYKEMVYSDEAEALGSKIHFIPQKGEHPFRHLTEIYKLLKAYCEYDTVYFNILNAAVAYSMIPAFLLRRKIIVHSHNGSANNTRKHKLFRGLLNFFASKRLACSTVAAKFMFGDKAVKKGEVTVINNAISIKDYTFNSKIRQKKRDELKLNDDLTIVHVGRMDYQKNPIYMLDIFSKLLKIKPNSTLLYLGTGDMKDEVEEYAKQKQINEKIRFLGVRSDVADYLQAADVFLLPSRFEGLPISAIEAQTADLYCFFSDSISPDVKLTDKSVFLSISENAEVWAKEIAKANIDSRMDNTALITKAGYNIEYEAEKVEKILL